MSKEKEPYQINALTMDEFEEELNESETPFTWMGNAFEVGTLIRKADPIFFQQEYERYHAELWWTCPVCLADFPNKWSAKRGGHLCDEQERRKKCLHKVKITGVTKNHPESWLLK